MKNEASGEVSGPPTDEASVEVLTREASGEVSGILTGEASVEVGEGEKLNRVDGANCLSVTSPGLRGLYSTFPKVRHDIQRC